MLESIDGNFNIIKANSGEEALETTLIKKIDLIVLDIQMPDMDGFEVAKLLKSNKKTKEIPIIFLTAAFKAKEWVDKGFELGAVDYLTKPIDENQFINRISLYTKLIKSVEDNRKKDKVLYEQTKMVSMGEMIANIAHQWRQPLSVISTAATGLSFQYEMGMVSKEQVIKTCEIVNDNAQYLSKTIDDFRNFIIGDKRKEFFNIKERLSGFENLINPSIRTDNIELDFHLDFDNSLKVQGYPNELMQCLINLFNNSKDALKVNKEDERFINIKVTIEDEKYLKIVFLDNGGGIREKIITKVFDAYFTTKHKSQGTGLGLHMIYNLITKGMEGEIKVRNNNVSYKNQEYKGAEFTIVIPIN